MSRLYFPLTIVENAFLALSAEAQREIAALFEPQPVAGGGGGVRAAAAAAAAWRPQLPPLDTRPLSPPARGAGGAEPPGAPARRVITRYPNMEEAEMGPGVYPPVWRAAPAAAEPPPARRLSFDEEAAPNLPRPRRRTLSFHDPEEGGAAAAGAAAAGGAAAAAGAAAPAPQSSSGSSEQC